MYKTLKNFAIIKGIKKKTLYSWHERGSRIPLHFITSILGEDFYDYLDGYYFVSGTSNYKLKIHKAIDTSEAILLGWILSEGHLGEYKLVISQKEKKPLQILQKLCTYYYGDCGAKIYPEKNGFKLQLPQIFVAYFNLRFGIPLGKKSYNIRAPYQIMEASDIIKYAFLTAYIEGDGTFSYFKTKYFKRPRIDITSCSKNFIEDCKILYSSLGYVARIYGGKTSEYKIGLYKSEDISKFYFYSYPFFIHENKMRKFESYLQQPYLLKTIFIDGKKITEDFRNKIGSWKEVSLALRNVGHAKSYLTIKNWQQGWFKPNLATIIMMCDYLEADYFKYVPKQ